MESEVILAASKESTHYNSYWEVPSAIFTFTLLLTACQHIRPRCNFSILCDDTCWSPDFHPSVDLSFSTVLLHVAVGFPGLLVPSGTHWSVILRKVGRGSSLIHVLPPPSSTLDSSLHVRDCLSLINLHLILPTVYAGARFNQSTAFFIK